MIYGSQASMQYGTKSASQAPAEQYIKNLPGQTNIVQYAQNLPGEHHAAVRYVLAIADGDQTVALYTVYM